MENVNRICPTVEELTTINNDVSCTEDGCSSVFTSLSNLNLHLIKTHKRTDLITEKKLAYYQCPEENCVYNENKFFKTMKLLKQHYLKVHATKIYSCETCEKSFPTESLKTGHSEYCGIMFSCVDCDESYNCYESLKTHCRRKSHVVLEKTLYKQEFNGELLKIKSKSVLNSVAGSSKGRKILPKPSSNVQMVIIPHLLVTDRSSQTDIRIPKLKSKRTQMNKHSVLMKRSTQETQTLGGKKPKLTVETQTIGDYSTVNNKKLLEKTTNEEFSCVDDTSLEKISIKTQTPAISSKEMSCNTSFIYDDVEFTSTSEVERSTSSTQTNISDNLEFSLGTSTHNSIHTDTSDLNIDTFSDNFDVNFFDTCTQTDLFTLDNDLLNCDYYYSNTHTQTCDDLFLNDIGFNNIETQTVFHDMLRSVKSQTMMSHTRKNNLSCNMSHIETQTDMEFQQMLEEINA